MIYEIIRNEKTGLVGLRFPGDIPVEVREAMLENGFSWIYHNGLWSGLDRSNDEIRSMIKTAEKSVKERPVMTKADEAALKDEYMARITSNGNEHWRKYYEEEIGVLVRLSDGRILNIAKPSIETRFCFGERGYDSDDAARMAAHARTNEEYFRSENLKRYKDMIDTLSRTYRDGYHGNEEVWVSEAYGGRPGIVSVNVGDTWCYWERKGERVPTVSEEDRERILEGYRKAYAAFEKRINTYLKRYGLSKVHSWTYWLDA